MAPRQSRTIKAIELLTSDEDSELSYVSESEQQSSSRAASKGASSSKAKGKGKQVESSSPPVKKKAKAGKGEETTKKQQQDLSLLFTMPLDILAEVCTHLPPRDLLTVCRTSKIFRTFLLSRQSRSVWLVSRAQAGFPTLQHIELSPLQYILNLFGNGLCEICNLSRAEPIYAIKIRQCKECRKDVLVVKGSNLKRELPNLHPRALECTPHPEVKTYRSAWRGGKIMWRKDQLMEASDKLEELEAEDAKETEARRILELRAKGGGRNTRRANQAVSDGIDIYAPHTDRVGTYVAEQKAWAEGCIKEEAQIWKVFDDEQAERARRMREVMVRQRAEEALKQQQICTDLRAIGWTQTEVDGWTRFRTSFGFRAFGDTPKTNKQGWEAAKKLVNDRLAEEATRNAELVKKHALQQRQRQRQLLLGPYYDALLAAEPAATYNIFPRREAFLALPTVKSFWELDEDDGGEKLSSMRWKQSRKLVKQEIKGSVESARVEVIRAILAASRDVDIATLSKKPAKYPSTTYDDKFFKKITSGSIRSNWTWGLGGGQNVLTIDYYPDYLSPTSAWPTGFRTSPLRISTIRAILGAADLDEDTATEVDLDKLGGRIRWLEYPVYKKSKATWSWKELIMEVERRKRKRKSKDLKVTIVVDDAPDAGAATPPPVSDDELMEMEEESDEEEDEEAEQGDSEAGPSAPRRRRRPQQGDGEEQDDGADSQMGDGEFEMGAEEMDGEGSQLGDGGEGGELGDGGEGVDELDSDEE